MVMRARFLCLCVTAAAGAGLLAQASARAAGHWSQTPAAAATASISVAGFTGCVSAHGGYALNKKVIGWLLPQLPPSVATRMTATVIPGDNTDPGQGVSAFLLVGRDRLDSTALRDKVAALLGASAAGQTSGVAGQAAWLSVPTRRATATEVKQARKTLQLCLSAG
jgi:hypothetical protein